MPEVKVKVNLFNNNLAITEARSKGHNDDLGITDARSKGKK